MPSSQSIFKSYSFKRCKFECSYFAALEATGCIPWNIYHLDNDYRSPVCTGKWTTLFMSVMANNSVDCDCLPNCDEVQYDAKFDSNRLDENYICQNPSIKNLARRE